ncbi:MAG: hypothetical protein ACLTLQ_08485 [[Clostridium] scindens]
MSCVDDDGKALPFRGGRRWETEDNNKAKAGTKTTRHNQSSGMILLGKGDIERENISVTDEHRATHQDTYCLPIKIGPSLTLCRLR